MKAFESIIAETLGTLNGHLANIRDSYSSYSQEYGELYA
jgi:hypothetical protein